MSVKTKFEVHPKTGFPIEPVPTFKVGDLVTETFLSDGYPGVVVHVTPKTVWVSRVGFQGAFEPGDVPGWNGYGDSGTIVVDPESVDLAIADGKAGAHKYVHRVYDQPARVGSFADRDAYGTEFYHRAKWAIPNSGAGSIHPGARYRQDPHI